MQGSSKGPSSTQYCIYQGKEKGVGVFSCDLPCATEILNLLFPMGIKTTLFHFCSVLAVDSL